MIVSIQFDDQNFALASAIGVALSAYGDTGAVNVPHVQAERVDIDDVPEARVTSIETPEVEVIETEDVASEVVSPFGRVPTTADTSPDVVPATPTPIIPTTSPVGLPSRLDENGVAHDPLYCGEAKDPFYGSGKRKGQWKKLRGLSDADYDKWYFRQKGAGSVPEPTQDVPMILETSGVRNATVTPVTDTTAAFAGEPEPTPPPADDAPIGAGQLMKWISEQMNANHLTQADVDSAYVTADVTPAQLFSPDDNTDAVSKLYGVLQASLTVGEN